MNTGKFLRKLLYTELAKDFLASFQDKLILNLTTI